MKQTKLLFLAIFLMATGGSVLGHNWGKTMPLYNNSFPPSAVTRGIDVTIVNNEQLEAGNNSQRPAIAQPTGRDEGPVTVTFSYAYASAPAAVQYDIYVAWDDKSRNIEQCERRPGDDPAAGGPNFRLLLVKEVISPGVNALVQVRE